MVLKLNAKGMKRNVILGVRLTKSEKSALYRLAELESLRPSATLRLLLREGLERRGLESLTWSDFLVSRRGDDGQPS